MDVLLGSEALPGPRLRGGGGLRGKHRHLE
jgi:hypothetical protein